MRKTGDDKFDRFPESLLLHTSTLIVVKHCDHHSKPYKDSKSCIKQKGMTGDWFDVVTSVRQGCISSPLRFAIVMDWITKIKVTDEVRRWTGMDRLCDLDYADDISPIETSQTGMPKLTREIKKTSGSVGLRMNAEKCKIMVSSDWEDDTAAEGVGVD